MISVDEHTLIDEEELLLSATRASGPGGQNVNKVSTRITLKFHVERSRGLTDMQKELLARVLRTRISRGGYLVLHEERSRTQAANRRAVIVKFASLLKKALAEPEERIPTRVSRAQREKRIREKKRKAGIKIIRRDRVPPEGDE